MGRRWLVAAGVFVATAIACVDIFHSTSTQSLCDLDASALDCPEGSICATSPTVAQTEALDVCAWLSACEHPVGNNAPGACMARAILAYDCNANPNRPPEGKAADFWRCMLRVLEHDAGCAGVNACVFPAAGGAGGCRSGGYLGCSQDPNGANPDTRYDCVVGTLDSGALTPGDDCAMVGQTCDSLDRDASPDSGSGNNNALCVGVQARTCTPGFTGCGDGGFLVLCDDGGIDRGYDCNSTGAQSCNPTGSSPACQPQPLVGSSTCVTSGDITCSSANVAHGCVTGVAEQIECAALSGTCVPIDGGAPGTLPSDACFVADGGCDADLCDNDGGVVACVRGRSVEVPCTALGLGPCNSVQTELGFFPSCTPP